VPGLASNIKRYPLRATGTRQSRQVEDVAFGPRQATAGCFAFAPRGIAHTFTVDVEPTRVLVLASPAGFEHFAFELGEQAQDDTPPTNLAMPSPEVPGQVGERYGIEVVGPPRRAR
jgi:hypothetical protein